MNLFSDIKTALANKYQINTLAIAVKLNETKTSAVITSTDSDIYTGSVTITGLVIDLDYIINNKLLQLYDFNCSPTKFFHTFI